MKQKIVLVHDVCFPWDDMKGTSTGIKSVGNLVVFYLGGADQETDPRYPIDLCFSISIGINNRNSVRTHIHICKRETNAIKSTLLLIKYEFS